MLAASSDKFRFELSEVEAAVGKRSFQRGRGYVRGGRVRSLVWDPGGKTLTGSVAGSGGLYETAAFFVCEQDGSIAFEEASARARSATTASMSRRW